jgi:hypothetical protein
MPKITQNGKLFRDWEALLGACDKNASQLAGMETMRTELENLLAMGREVKVEQENLRGSKLATTQRFQQIKADGEEAARKLRGFVLSRIGTKTELGKQFGLVPTGRKPRKAKTTVVVKPPAPPTPPASKVVEKSEPSPDPKLKGGEA